MTVLRIALLKWKLHQDPMIETFSAIINRSHLLVPSETIG